MEVSFFIPAACQEIKFNFLFLQTLYYCVNLNDWKTFNNAQRIKECFFFIYIPCLLSCSSACRKQTYSLGSHLFSVHNNLHVYICASIRCLLKIRHLSIPQYSIQHNNIFFFYIVVNHFTKFVDPADTSIFCSKIVSRLIFCIRFTQVNRQGAIHVRLTRWELKAKIRAAYLTVVECKRT